jgi:hypothetical protein
MGITISATHSSYSFDMGYGGFFNLRKNIALALDNELGEMYAEYSRCATKRQFKEIDNIIEHMINRKHLDKDYKDVLDFLYMPDCEGKIGYKTCKKIADLLEPCMAALRNKCFRYAAYAGHDYEDFVAFLRECYRYHRNMRWY